MPSTFLELTTCEMCHREPTATERDDTGHITTRAWVRYNLDFLRVSCDDNRCPNPEPVFNLVICPECWPIFWKAIHLEAPALKVQRELALSIDSLRLKFRSWNCLRAAGVLTVGELVNLEPWQLMGLKHFGRKSLQDVEEVLAKMKLSLKKEDR